MDRQEGSDTVFYKPTVVAIIEESCFCGPV